MPPKLSGRDKGLAIKAENEAKKEQLQREAEERREAMEWQKGAKDNSKAKLEAEKEAEKLRKKREIEEAEAQDAAEAAKILSGKGGPTVTTASGGGGGGAIGGGGGGGAKKAPKKDDSKALAAILAAVPKSKKQIEEEKKAKEAEEKRKKDEEKRLAKEEAARQKQIEDDKLRAKGIVIGASEDLMIEVKKINLGSLEASQAIGSDGSMIETASASNIDDALNVFVFGGADGPTTSEQMSAKSAYRAFCDQEKPKLRDEKPGLRSNQYNAMLFDMWKRSPMNPFVNKGKLLDRDWWKYENQENDSDDDDASGSSHAGKPATATATAATTTATVPSQSHHSTQRTRGASIDNGHGRNRSSSIDKSQLATTKAPACLSAPFALCLYTGIANFYMVFNEFDLFFDISKEVLHM